MKHKSSSNKANLIFETAIQLFREKGYEKTSIKDICKACNVPVGSIYHFYNQKMDFLIRVAEDISVRGDKILNESANDADFFELLSQYYLDKSRALTDAGYYLSKSMYENFEKIWMTEDGKYNHNSGFYTILPFIQKHKDLGHIVSDYSPEEIAHLIQAFYAGLVEHWLHTHASSSLVECTKRFFIPLIKKNLTLSRLP